MLGKLPTVTHICRVAKRDALDALPVPVPGRPGTTAEAAELTAAREEIKRLRATTKRPRCTDMQGTCPTNPPPASATRMTTAGNPALPIALSAWDDIGNRTDRGR
jgi:hypothetical protein